ncbi:MAG: EVE domain-containing protein [Bacteroidota bacterium]
MSYWLVKSEPEEYSFADLIAEKVGCWDGVRNYQARNNLRAMKMDDLVFFYHSRQGLEVVGLAKVVGEAYPDPTAEKGDWSAVDLAPLRLLKKPVSLKAIKAESLLQDMALVRNPRLSVTPISEEAFSVIMEMAEETMV